MDFNAKNIDDVLNIMNEHIFRLKWAENSIFLDLLHRLGTWYKKFNFNDTTVPLREICHNIKNEGGRFKSWKELHDENLIERRKSNRVVLTQDVEDELLRREVCAQMDDAWWGCCERYVNTQRDERKRQTYREGNDNKKKLRIVVDGLCELKQFKISRNTNNKTQTERVRKAKEILKAHPFIFEKGHELYCFTSDICKFLEENILSPRAKGEIDFDAWVQENCVKQKTSKIALRIKEKRKRRQPENHAIS